MIGSKLLMLFAVLLLIMACDSENLRKKGATFYWFEYRGQDTFYLDHALGINEYYNPILGGFYPDPSICRKGDDYYMVNSTFSFFPGVSVFHSTDLVHWSQIGYVLNRKSQLNITNQDISEGIFAPAISYNPYNDTFYLVTTFVGGIDNFIVKAGDPAGPWSDPILIPEVSGIDPSLFFDDDGRAWIVNNGAPEEKPLYPGHRAIWIQEFDTDSDKVKGLRKVLVNGGCDISTNPVWIEGPHLYKANGYYYLMAAEGGTEENHSEVIFRSKNVTGSYSPFAGNPILTQRDLSDDRSNPVTCTGHADMIQDPGGDWWAVFLGCRPYKDNHYNTGRETFLLPVHWYDQWPVITEKGRSVPLIGKKEHLEKDIPGTYFPSGNFVERDEFDGDSLALYWNFIRTPQRKWYSLEEGALKISCEPVSFREKKNPAFIGRRQQHIRFTATTAVSIIPDSYGDCSGLVCFRTESNNYFLGISSGQNGLVAFVDKTIRRNGQLVRKRLAIKKTDLTVDNAIYLRVVGRDNVLDFFISEDNNVWESLAEGQDATYLSTATAGGFVGTYIGMYAGSRE
jgi:xylan 1,4-beta-xylosidase